MRPNLKSWVVTVGMSLLLLAVAILAWDVITADQAAVATEQITPDLQTAAQP